MSIEFSHHSARYLHIAIIPLAKKAFRLAREGYDKGRFPYLEVLDAQRTLSDARAQYHDALLRLHTAQADVMRLSTINDTIKE